MLRRIARREPLTEYLPHDGSSWGISLHADGVAMRLAEMDDLRWQERAAPSGGAGFQHLFAFAADGRGVDHRSPVETVVAGLSVYLCIHAPYAVLGADIETLWWREPLRDRSTRVLPPAGEDLERRRTRGLWPQWVDVAPGPDWMPWIQAVRAAGEELGCIWLGREAVARECRVAPGQARLVGRTRRVFDVLFPTGPANL